jgi:RHS repeat-associated protein
MTDCERNDISLPADIQNLPYLNKEYETALEAGGQDKLYYFNANHLGSGSLITDGNGQTYQTLAYAPYGEIICDIKNGSNDERYKFGGKELDNESGLYNFEIRPLDVNLNFITTDLLWYKKPWQSSYLFCSNDPINRVDPTGMTDYVTENGNVIGNDGQKDDNIRIVKDRKEIKTIKTNNKNGGTTQLENVKSGISTTRTELTESLDVLERTEANGGRDEEASVVTPDGRIVRGERGNGNTGTFPYVEGDNNTSIHSHPLTIEGSVREQTSYPASKPSPLDPDFPNKQNDITTFKTYNRNIIVGYLWEADPNALQSPKTGAVIYDINGNRQATLTRNAIQLLKFLVNKNK